MKEPTMVRLTADSLTLHPLYQRTVDPVHLAKLVRTFHAPSLGAVIISLRPDGSRIVIDGQHRTQAAIASGYSGKLLAVQHAGLSLADEARMFLNLNESKFVQAVDKFSARVIAEDADALFLNDTLESWGWKVNNAPSSGSFSAVASLEAVYRGAGVLKGNGPWPALPERVIETVTLAWRHDYKSVHNTIVRGLGQLHARYGDRVDQQRLISVLCSQDPALLVNNARALSAMKKTTRPISFADGTVGSYNKGLRTNRLPDWRWSK